MANKRMFNKQVISTDDFLDMPLSSQALYFHLSINADDDGFVAPKSIMRMVQAATDDLKILITKKFVIPFDDKVIVITHWFLHNTLKNDRYTPTEFQQFKQYLALSESKMYRKTKSGTYSAGTIPEPRLDKNRLDKNRKVETIVSGEQDRRRLMDSGLKKYSETKHLF